MTHTDYESRPKMIRYLDFLMRKDHILCRSTLNKYRVKLDMNDYLTSKEFKQILNFLVRDVKQEKKELKTLFGPIIRSSKSINKPSPEITLDAFFD